MSLGDGITVGDQKFKDIIESRLLLYPLLSASLCLTP